LGELTAGLVAQGLTILDSVKRNLAASPTARAGVDPDADDGDGGGGPAPPGGSVGGGAAPEPGRGAPRQPQRPPGALDGCEATCEPARPAMNARRDEDFTGYVQARLAWLRRVAYLLCQDWQQADDLVQTAITSLYVHWRRARAMESIDGYARTILV